MADLGLALKLCLRLPELARWRPLGELSGLLRGEISGVLGALGSAEEHFLNLAVLASLQFSTRVLS